MLSCHWFTVFLLTKLHIDASVLDQFINNYLKCTFTVLLQLPLLPPVFSVTNKGTK